MAKTKSTRTSISKKLRFEVFKRDSFTCQYCGLKAPDVVLHIDHIHPHAKGGDASIMNLITACFDCNMGKKDRVLTDSSVLDKQRDQLKLLQEKREQLKLMAEWREGLKNMDSEMVVSLRDYLCVEFGNKWGVSDTGMQLIKKWLKKYTYIELCNAIDICAIQYISHGKDGVTVESWRKAFDYVPRVANGVIAQKNNPELFEIYKMRSLMRSKYSYISEWEAVNILKQAFKDGLSLEDMWECVKVCSNWTQFKNTLEAWVADV